MLWLAMSIFASTVLLLVDRNHVWREFWRVTAIVLVTTAALFLGAVGYHYYAAPPQTLPANFQGWDK